MNDGEVEELHDHAPRRPLIPVTEPEPRGHIRADADRAAIEQRAARGPYRELPLTGAMQSMMPPYRLSESFGRIRLPDEYGYYPGAEAAAEHEVSCGLCRKGRGVRLRRGWRSHGASTSKRIRGDAEGYLGRHRRVGHELRPGPARLLHTKSRTRLHSRRIRLPTAPRSHHALGRTYRAPAF